MDSVYVPVTHGGYIDAASRSALRMSENDGSTIDGTPLHEILSGHLGRSSTGATSGSDPDVNSAAGSRSMAEEQNGLPQASNAQPVRDGFAAAMTDRMFGEDPSPTLDFDLWIYDLGGNSFSSSEGSQHPPEDMLAGITASSSTAASGPVPDANNAPLNGAFQQSGNMALGSSTGLPELTPGEGWDLDNEDVQAFKRELMGDDSSTTMAGNRCIDPHVLMRGAGNSANTTAENAPAVPLAGPTQPAMTMDVGSSTSNSAQPTVNGENLVGGAQANGQMGASNSANNPVAPNAVFGGFNQPQMQMGVVNSATNFNFVAPHQATPSGHGQPQMPMGAGSSTNINFAAQQQFSVASNATFNGGFQPLDHQLNAAPQVYPYPVAGNNTPFDGIMGQYPRPSPSQAGSAPGNWVNQQQQQALNGNTLPQMGQNWHAAAPQPAVDIAVARIRRRRPDFGAPSKRRRTDPATAAPAPAVQALAVQAQAPVPALAAAPAPVQQQVPAQEGPYPFTAAGVPNLNPNRKGNKQGQVPGWTQAFKHHDKRCDRYKLNGCIPDCELRVRWPLTWADWNSRRFQIRWKEAQHDRPEHETLSGFAVYAETRGKGKPRFVVLGEIQADGLVGKQKEVVRVDREAVKE